MTKVNFTTAISYDLPTTRAQRDLSNIEGILSFNGMRARVVKIDAATKTEYAVLTKVSVAWYFTALKILALMTVILPLILLLAKVIARSQHKFIIVDANSLLDKPKEPIINIEKPIDVSTAQPKTMLVATTAIRPSFARSTSVLKNIQFQVSTGTLKKQTSWKQTLKAVKETVRENTIATIGKGLNVTPEMEVRIQKIIDQVIHRNTRPDKPKDLVWVSQPNKSNTLVFSLDGLPDIIFKVGNPKIHSTDKIVDAKNFDEANKQTTDRFNNAILAKQFLDASKLDLLVLPKTKIFSVLDSTRDKYLVVAEERLNFDKSNQEKLFNNPKMMETAKQFAVFIAKTGYWDVEYRNNPVLAETPSHKGTPKIGLIDLDNMDVTPEYLSTGIFGVNWGGKYKPAGLVKLLHHKDQVEEVANIANSFKIEDPFETKANRIKELELNGATPT